MNTEEQQKNQHTVPAAGTKANWQLALQSAPGIPVEYWNCTEEQLGEYFDQKHKQTN